MVLQLTFLTQYYQGIALKWCALYKQ